MGVCNCSMFCCTLLYAHSSIAIILMGKRELIALLNLSSWCLVMVERLFLAVPQGCLLFVIVIFPDYTHLLVLALKYLQINLVNSCSNYQVFPVLLIHTYVNSSHTFIVFLILNSWETDLQKSIDFLLNPFFVFRNDLYVN